jgi:hypothetical protein
MLCLNLFYGGLYGGLREGTQTSSSVGHPNMASVRFTQAPKGVVLSRIEPNACQSWTSVTSEVPADVFADSCMRGTYSRLSSSGTWGPQGQGSGGSKRWRRR